MKMIEQVDFVLGKKVRNELRKLRGNVEVNLFSPKTFE